MENRGEKRTVTLFLILSSQGVRDKGEVRRRRSKGRERKEGGCGVKCSYAYVMWYRKAIMPALPNACAKRSEDSMIVVRCSLLVVVMVAPVRMLSSPREECYACVACGAYPGPSFVVDMPRNAESGGVKKPWEGFVMLSSTCHQTRQR